MSKIEGDLKGGTASKHLNAISDRILEQDPHPAGDMAAGDQRTRPGKALDLIADKWVILSFFGCA